MAGTWRYTHKYTQKHMYLCRAQEHVTWLQEKMTIKLGMHCQLYGRDGQARFGEWTAYCQECSSLFLAWCQHQFLEQWCLTVVDRLEGGDGPFKQVAGNQEDEGWIAAARKDRMRRDRKQRRNNEHRWIISFVIHTNSQTTCNLHSRQMFSEDFECWC